MNIIEMQDRLKGLPDQALVDYVEQPMGEVPIYLALGELQRRKEMRERFQAIPSPETTTVSEKIVAESKPMAMGLGAMAQQRMMSGAQGVGVPPQRVQMDPRQMAASGIAANPVTNVGSPAMMAGGGIVGYSKAGMVKKGFGKVRDFLLGSGTAEAGSDAAKNILRRYPKTSVTAGGIGAYNIFSDDEDETLNKGEGVTQEEYDAFMNQTAPSPKPKPGKKTEIAPNKTIEERFKSIQSILGTDPERESLAASLKEKEKNALNMALIQGGLGMAAGQSDDFLQNLAAGATAGVDSFVDTQDEILIDENKLGKQAIEKQVALLGQALLQDEAALKRATDLAIANIAGPQVAKAAAPAAKVIADLQERQTMNEIALEAAIRNGDEELAKKIRATIIDIEKVKRRKVADSVALSADPYAYGESGGTGAATNLDLSQFNVVK